RDAAAEPESGRRGGRCRSRSGRRGCGCGRRGRSGSRRSGDRDGNRLVDVERTVEPIVEGPAAGHSRGGSPRPSEDRHLAWEWAARVTRTWTIPSLESTDYPAHRTDSEYDGVVLCRDTHVGDQVDTER